MKSILVFILILLAGFGTHNLSAQNQRTFCNPVNLDYGFTPIPDFSKAGHHRATADPVMVLYKDNYFLFSTNQWGYWWSKDMISWNFIPRRFLRPWNKVYDELCAPAVWTSGDTMFVVGSAASKNFSIWRSTDPFRDDWQVAVDSSGIAAWDPDYFLDDDGKLYLYYGSSNLYPIYGIEINRTTLQPERELHSLIRLHDDEHGWERFGENNDNDFLDPFIEGAWMTKHNGIYYLQYGAPGTEIKGYADGVYTSDHPFGPWTYQSHNPFCYKPEGFTRGSGHGSTYRDVYGNWWHITTTTIAVKNTFERRLSIFPAGFDADNILYANTAFGDYPMFLPDSPADHLKGCFTGWMLLNHEKPVKVSSTLGAYSANFAVDEDIRTYWCAKTASPGEWIETDLGSISRVNAIQINYADQDVPYLGKRTDIYHQYRLWKSDDGKNWTILVDKSKNLTDVPHDYVELKQPVETRYIKLENIHMAAGKFAISGLRVFGKAPGAPPDSIIGFEVFRQQSDRRNAYIKWYPDKNAYAYNLYYGIDPDKLYNSIMIYTRNEYYLKALDKNTTYYFAIEGINESGIGPRTPVIKLE